MKSCALSFYFNSLDSFCFEFVQAINNVTNYVPIKPLSYDTTFAPVYNLSGYPKSPVSLMVSVFIFKLRFYSRSESAIVTTTIFIAKADVLVESRQCPSLSNQMKKSNLTNRLRQNDGK